MRRRESWYELFKIFLETRKSQKEVRRLQQEMQQISGFSPSAMHTLQMLIQSGSKAEAIDFLRKNMQLPCGEATQKVEHMTDMMRKIDG